MRMEQEGPGRTQNTSPEQHAENKRAAKARRATNRRPGSHRVTETLYDGIKRDRREKTVLRASRPTQCPTEIFSNALTEALRTASVRENWTESDLRGANVYATALVYGGFCKETVKVIEQLNEKVKSAVEFRFALTYAHKKQRMGDLTLPGMKRCWFPEMHRAANQYFETRRVS